MSVKYNPPYTKKEPEGLKNALTRDCNDIIPFLRPTYLLNGIQPPELRESLRSYDYKPDHKGETDIIIAQGEESILILYKHQVYKEMLATIYDDLTIIEYEEKPNINTVITYEIFYTTRLLKPLKVMTQTNYKNSKRQWVTDFPPLTHESIVTLLCETRHLRYLLKQYGYKLYPYECLHTNQKGVLHD